jgi:hypothetical protein
MYGPRVGVEDRPRRALATRLDRQQRDVFRIIAGDRPAENNDPPLDQPIGKRGVLIKERLLPATPRVIPVRPLSRPNREHRPPTG